MCNRIKPSIKLHKLLMKSITKFRNNWQMLYLTCNYFTIERSKFENKCWIWKLSMDSFPKDFKMKRITQMQCKKKLESKGNKFNNLIKMFLNFSLISHTWELPKDWLVKIHWIYQSRYRMKKMILFLNKKIKV